MYNIRILHAYFYKILYCLQVQEYRLRSNMVFFCCCFDCFQCILYLSNFRQTILAIPWLKLTNVQTACFYDLKASQPPVARREYWEDVLLIFSIITCGPLVAHKQWSCTVQTVYCSHQLYSFFYKSLHGFSVTSSKICMKNVSSKKYQEIILLILVYSSLNTFFTSHASMQHASKVLWAILDPQQD